jgi:chaperonin GroEL
VALLRARKALDNVKADGDETIGVEILRQAVEVPLKTIAENAGVNGAIAAQAVLESDGSYGFNALKNEYGDMFKAGIIDPTKVVRTALENAASVASLLITTDALIGEIPEKKKPAPPAPTTPAARTFSTISSGMTASFSGKGHHRSSSLRPQCRTNMKMSP